MTAISEARSHDRAKPVYLVEIILSGPTPPTLYLSDRNITVASQLYEDYLDSLSGLGAELKRVDSSGLNVNAKLDFKNDRYMAHAHLIGIGEANPFDGATCLIKEVYLGNDGTPSASEILFKGKLDEPRNIDVMKFTCAVSTMEHAADNTW